MPHLHKQLYLICLTLLTSLHADQFQLPTTACTQKRLTFKPYNFQPNCSQSANFNAKDTLTCVIAAGTSNTSSAALVTSLTNGTSCQVTPSLCPQYKLIGDNTIVLVPAGITVLEHVVFSIKSGCGIKVWDLFRGASPANSDYVVQPAHPDAATLPIAFRSSLLDNMQSLISRLIFKHFIVQLYRGTTVVQRLVFDVGSSSASVTNMNWFDKSKLIQSTPVTHLASITMIHFSIAGEASIERRFFIGFHYGGCNVDKALMVVLDQRTDPCAMYRFDTAIPRILYSGDVTQPMDTSRIDADYMAILVV